MTESDEPRARIFVSSVMEGYSEFREAARRGIEAAGAEPVLAEDFPSMASSPRNACLDGVASCDGLVLLIGGRGGWETPSGKLAVEEEFEEAQRRRQITLAFVQEVDRDAPAQAFEKRVSEYVDGRFLSTYGDPDGLEDLVEHAVKQAFGRGAKDASHMAAEMDRLLDDPKTFGYEASVRLVVTPERDEQVLDPVEFEKSSFKGLVNELAHAGESPLLSYDFGKQYEVTVNSFGVSQRPNDRGAGPLTHADLLLVEDGTVVIDLSVTGERGDHRQAFQRSMTVIEADVERALETAFGFVARLFERIDPFGRHQRFSHNVVLHNLGHRTMTRDTGPKQSYGMRMREGDVRAFVRPRVIGRTDLHNPSPEIEAAVTMFRRQLSGT